MICLPFIGFSQNQLLDKGGGEHIYYQQEKCLDDNQRVLIKKEIEETSAALKESGEFPILSKSNLSFQWPLKHNPSLNYNCTYTIQYYVQHFNFGMVDYSCGLKTYQGHNGTDIATWPFPWYLSHNDQVIAVAAEQGVIIVKHDGEDDNCGTNTQWNAIYLEHNDGSHTWYGHLKKNSLTNKTIGQVVNKGEMLGVVSSSGLSYTPHLHFEVYDFNGDLIDPFYENISNSCNQLNNISWWENQKSYQEPTLNAVLTHYALPVHGCPSSNEFPNFSNFFNTGDSIYTAIYFHDEMQGDTSFLTIKTPSNFIWESWIHITPSTASASWWYWKWQLPPSGPFGLWSFEVTYNGLTTSHNFHYNTSTDIPTSLNEKKKLIKTVDILGRETKPQTNIPLIEIYDDGTVEKRITIE